MPRRISLSVILSRTSDRSHPLRIVRTRGACTMRPRADRRRRIVVGALALAVCLSGLVLAPYMLAARDLDGRYANSPLKSWFESLHSRKGPCCSDADGTALSDVDWEARDGHYRVRIEGQWWDVPEEAVIREPNRAGRTMVWPIYYNATNHPLRVEVRCFIPGTMT